MPQPIKIGTKLVPKALWPIFYSPKENEKPTPEIIRKRAIEHEPGPIERLSYLALGGIITTVIGAITGTVGFFKENSLGKWIGAALTFLGIEAFITGFFGSVDLSKTPGSTKAKNAEASPGFFQELSEITDDKLTNESVTKLAKKYNLTEQEITKQGIEILLDETIQNPKYKGKIKSGLEIIGLSKANLEAIDKLANPINKSSGLEALNQLGTIDADSLSEAIKSKFEEIKEKAKERAKNELITDLKNKEPGQLINKYRTASSELVPIIIDVCTNPEHQGLQKLAKTCLETVGNSKKIESLIKYLTDEKTAEVAKEILGSMKDKDTILKLASVMQDKERYSKETRIQVIKVLEISYAEPTTELNEIKNEKIITPALKSISTFDEGESASFEATIGLLGKLCNKNDKETIGRIKEYFIRYSKQLQDSGNSFFPVIYCLGILTDLLANSRDNSMINVLFQLLETEEIEPSIPTQAAWAIGRIFHESNDKKITERLIRSLDHENIPCPARDNIVVAIGKVGGKEAFQYLQRIQAEMRKIPRANRSPEQKTLQSKINEAIGHTLAQEPFLDSVRDDPATVTQTQHDDSVDNLLPKPAPQQQEVNITHIPKLVEVALTEKDEARVTAARRHLLEFGQKNSTDDLITHLNSDNVEVSIWAAASLGIKQKKKADKTLLTCVNSEANLNVRASAAIALGRKIDLSDTKLVKALSNCLIQYIQSDTIHSPTRLEAIDILTKIGSTEVLDPLSTLKKEEGKNAFETIEAREKPQFVKNFKTHSRANSKWQKEFLKPYLSSPKTITGWLTELAIKNSDTLQFRLDAVKCIEQIGSNEAILALGEVSQKATRDVKKEAANAIQRLRAQAQIKQPALKTTRPQRQQNLLEKLNETDDLVTFLAKYKGNEVKRELTAIANDRELNNSRDGLQCRLKAIICLGAIGKRKTQDNLQVISKGDPIKFIRETASAASDFIEEKISNNPDEQLKEECLKRFKSLARVGTLVDYQGINVLLKEFSVSGFKPKLMALLSELISTKRNDFDYLALSDFEYERLQKLAIYALGEIGDTKIVEFLDQYLASPPNNNIADLKHDIQRAINKIKGIPDPKPTRPATLQASFPVNPSSAKPTTDPKNPLKIISSALKAEVLEIAKHFIEPEDDPKKPITSHDIGKALASAISAYAKSKRTTVQKILDKHDVTIFELNDELCKVTIDGKLRFRPKNGGFTSTTPAKK